MLCGNIELNIVYNIINKIIIKLLTYFETELNNSILLHIYLKN